MQIDGAHPHLIMHPTGKYMYIVCEQVTAVLRSDYNPITKEFEYPRVIAGHLSATGYTDGVGGAARFDRIYAGVFVKKQRIRSCRQGRYLRLLCNREVELRRAQDYARRSGDYFCREKQFLVGRQDLWLRRRRLASGSPLQPADRHYL